MESLERHSMVEGNGAFFKPTALYPMDTCAIFKLAFHGCLFQNCTSEESIGCHYSRLETSGIHASGSDNLVAMVQ
jgi:hypothetical protein